MSKTGQWLLEMQEDAIDMTLNEFMAEHGTSQQVIDVWTAKQVEALKTIIEDKWASVY